MSSLNFSPADIVMIALFLCWPGIVVGLVVGAIGWPRHRLWGGVLGALAGAALWRPQRLSGTLFGASAGFVLWLYASYLLR
jgi:hypothetical protein